MVKYEVGALYLIERPVQEYIPRTYLLGIQTQQGEKQLISTLDSNLYNSQGKIHKVLLFKPNIHETFIDTTLLNEENIKKVGNIEPRSIRPLEEEVINHMRVDKGQPIINGFLNSQKVIVVLPKDFSENYIF